MKAIETPVHVPSINEVVVEVEVKKEQDEDNYSDDFSDKNVTPVLPEQTPIKVTPVRTIPKVFMKPNFTKKK